jgi:transposase
MVRQEEWMDIRALHEQGISIREIAKRAGRSRKAVRKVLRSSDLPGKVRQRPPSAT